MPEPDDHKRRQQATIVGLMALFGVCGLAHYLDFDLVSDLGMALFALGTIWVTFDILRTRQ